MHESHPRGIKLAEQLSLSGQKQYLIACFNLTDILFNLEDNKYNQNISVKGSILLLNKL